MDMQELAELAAVALDAALEVVADRALARSRRTGRAAPVEPDRWRHCDPTDTATLSPANRYTALELFGANKGGHVKTRWRKPPIPLTRSDGAFKGRTNAERVALNSLVREALAAARGL